MILIGLGTGRSGSASFANLISAQKNAFCFHEMNPAVMRFTGTPRPALNTLDEFQAIIDGGDPAMITADLSRWVVATAYDDIKTRTGLKFIGDIGMYYLSYVEEMAAHTDQVRFICLKRDRAKTVESWMKKSSLGFWLSKRLGMRLTAWLTRQPFVESRNFWMDHDGTKWAPDPVWDKLFPHFKASSKRDAIEQYYDFYYKEAERLEAALGHCFRIQPTAALSDLDEQKALLDFCGFPEADQVLTPSHLHKSAP